ncbi:MAG: transposase [Crocosphaera sp.]|nr:transposase [Crocosphaera sp.]
MYGTKKVKLKVCDAVKAHLSYLCQHSNNLINATIYYVRQAHFEVCFVYHYFDKDGFYRTGRKDRYVKVSYAKLCKIMKEHPSYKVLGGQCAQQTIKSVVESFRSYNGLLKAYWKGEITNRPKLPNYRKKGGLAVVSYPFQAIGLNGLNLETGECTLPISRELKEDIKNHLNLEHIKVNGCYGITIEQLSEVRIVPQNRQLYVEYSYKLDEIEQPLLDYSLALGLDHGVTNLVTGVSNFGKSFIVDGRKIKSINQRYNRAIALKKKAIQRGLGRGFQGADAGSAHSPLAFPHERLNQEGKHRDYWDDDLAKLTDKRNNQIRDVINKAARFIINYCLKHQIGNIVFGWNDGQKDSINIGKTNNQNFVQIPMARLKNRISELCKYYGIVFTETEESYTSRSSFLDNDLLPKFGEKPASYKFSGKRIKRGLYQTQKGWLINADCLGAINVLKKVATQLNISLTKVGKGALTLPKRYDLYKNISKSYRKRCESAFLTTRTTTV